MSVVQVSSTGDLITSELSTSRPVRTTAQISDAVRCTFDRADELMRLLCFMRLAEEYRGAWRKTKYAAETYPSIPRRA